MIAVRVNGSKTETVLDGDFTTINTEFFLLVRCVYRGIKESGGERVAESFRNFALHNLEVCFESNKELAERVSGMRETFQKEED